MDEAAVFAVVSDPQTQSKTKNENQITGGYLGTLSRDTGWLPVIEEGLSPNIFLSSFTGTTVRGDSRQAAIVKSIPCLVYLSGVTSSLLIQSNSEQTRR